MLRITVMPKPFFNIKVFRPSPPTSNFIFALICLLMSISEAKEFVVWNVGQGLFTTRVDDYNCTHLDMGGEYKLALTETRALCQKKTNLLFLSHWDLDHISLVKYLALITRDSCLAAGPGGSPHGILVPAISAIPSCQRISLTHNKVRVLYSAHGPTQLTRHSGPSANHESLVFYMPDWKIVVPGDSTSKEEKIWHAMLPKEGLGLVLGHHGSITSSGWDLLANHRFKWAVASSRYAKYHHPNFKIVLRLKELHIPLLLTEDWGNIHFQY